MNILDPQGPIAAAEKTILIDSIGIMLAIVLPTIAAIFAFAFWFRHSNPRARYQPAWAYSGRIELVVWSIPALTIILLGGVAWIGAHQLDPARPVEGNGKALTIQVVSLDWKWLFIYPDQKVAVVNELTVPVGVPLHFEMTSSSVMNAFFIPQFGSMIYVMNGMTSRLELRADREGDLSGALVAFQRRRFCRHAFQRSRRRRRKLTSANGLRIPRIPIARLTPTATRDLSKPSIEDLKADVSPRRSQSVPGDRNPATCAGTGSATIDNRATEQGTFRCSVN